MSPEYLTMNTVKHHTLLLYNNLLHVLFYQNDPRTLLILEFKEHKYIAIYKYLISYISLMYPYFFK